MFRPSLSFLLIAVTACTTFLSVCVESLSDYHQQIFGRNVEETLKEIRDILDKERNVQLAELQEHKYVDKFLLVEQQTHAMWSTLGYVLKRLGLKTLDASRGLNLYFEGKSGCTLEKEMEVEEVTTTSKETEVSKSGETTKTTQNARMIKTFHWNVTASYQVYACVGDCGQGKIDLKQRSMSTTAISKAKTPPVKLSGDSFGAKFNLTWWAQQFSENAYGFSIDRSHDSCKTPRRNKDVEDVLEFHETIRSWCQTVGRFLDSISILPHDAELRTASRIEGNFYYRPPPSLVPLLENSTVLSIDSMEQLLRLERAAFEKELSKFEEDFPPGRPHALLSFEEFTLNGLMGYLKKSVGHYEQSIDYVENMLRMQLISAIGRRIQPEDFDQYMRFHSRKIFADEFAPVPFSHAIRRPNQYPVGIVSIEETKGEPVQTFSRRISGKTEPPILIPIDSATTLEMTGDRVLSGWVRYKFSSQYSRATGSSTLAARARQFSSYVLLIGTMTAPNTFDPKNAIILQNKDEVLITLLAEVLPSAKDFKDSIASLSPEQQEFAKAFRAMQLESSVFAFCLVQLKPQLERLLNIPENSLAKEIKLTEDLMSLFIDYQIPSDLLSYDGAGNNDTSHKVQIVKSYVNQVMEVIKATKKEQLKEERGRDEMYRASMHTASQTPSSSPSARPASASINRSTVKLRTVSYQADSPPMHDFSEPPEPQQTSSLGSQPLSTSQNDFTAIPVRLDSFLEEHDTEGYLRSTILKAETPWSRKRQPNLLSDPELETVDNESINTEKKKAFDLLDALSRSGTLPIASAELHVVIATTHCFERSVIDTVIQDNINPIVKAEKSAVMLSSMIHNATSPDLLTKESADRLAATFPSLFQATSTKR